MRLVSKYEDDQTRARIDFLEALVETQRKEILQMRAQIDEAREIPPYIFDTDTGKEAKVYVMNDQNMAKAQRGEKIDLE